MKKKGVIIGVIIAVIVIIAVSIIGSYNGLISLEESTNTAYSDIQVQLQRRMDLVPNLVNTVKGYAAHETEVFTAVSDARAKLAGAQREEITEYTSLNDKKFCIGGNHVFFYEVSVPFRDADHCIRQRSYCGSLDGRTEIFWRNPFRRNGEKRRSFRA